MVHRCARRSSTPRSTRALRGGRRRRDRDRWTSPAWASTCPGRPQRRPRGSDFRPATSAAGRTAELAVRTTNGRADCGRGEGDGDHRRRRQATTPTAASSRLHNVALVAQLIDGALIAPGETFSFNGTTGERTSDKGFLEAPVIINGELKTGLGGGICQVSTTTFNAAYEAGLSIAERTNHALLHLALPLGRDATSQLPRSGSEVHERHRQLAAPAHLRRVRLVDRQPMDASRIGGSRRPSSRCASSAHRR